MNSTTNGTTKQQIEIPADDQIFRQLGNVRYEKYDPFREFIDNSIASASKNGQDELNILIRVFNDKSDRENSYIEIIDNAGGIPLESNPPINLGIADCLSPGRTSKYNDGGINEHGLGMKQAIGAIGRLDFIKSKKVGDVAYKVSGPLGFDGLDLDVGIDFPVDSGTVIRINKLDYNNEGVEYWSQNPRSTYISIVRKLEAIYRYYLDHGSNETDVDVNITFMIADENRTFSDTEWTWNLDPAYPPRVHPENETDEWTHELKVETDELRALVKVGYAPDPDEYVELSKKNIWYDESYHPYTDVTENKGISATHQGFDLLKDRRVLVFNQYAEIGFVKTTNSGYNRITGEIHLLEGFQTRNAKNDIRVTPAVEKLIDKIKKKVKEHDPEYFRYVGDDGQQEEKVVSEMLQDDDVPGYNDVENVETDLTLPDGGEPDIIAERSFGPEVYEIKNSRVKREHVWQVFGYMQMLTHGGEKNFENGVLLGKSCSGSARKTMEFINENYDVDVNFYTFNKYLTGEYLAKL